MRFYDPLSGMLLLDGADLRSLKIGWLRTHIGMARALGTERDWSGRVGTGRH